MQPFPSAQGLVRAHRLSERSTDVRAGEKRKSRSYPQEPASPSKRQRSDPLRTSVDPQDALEARIERATVLLNARRPREALDVLAPAAGDEAAKGHYGFQSRLGTAYMGVADELVAASVLGSFLVTADDAGSWLNARVHAERVAYYIGVLGAYGTFLELLQTPGERVSFVEKNGAEALAEVEDGARAGLVHAMLEPVNFINRICQINCNNASRDDVRHAVESGNLNEADGVVRAFREVEADPLYGPILAATAVIDQAAARAGEFAPSFWFQWAQTNKQALFQLPAYELAKRHAGPLPHFA